MMDSTQFEWDTEKPEGYRLMTLWFDVREAKKILKAHPHPVQFAGRKQLENYVEQADYEMWSPERRAKEHGSFSLLASAKEDIIPTADPSLPLIFARLPGDNGSLMIDGANRLANGMRKGLKEFPVVALTEKESGIISRVHSESANWRKLFSSVADEIPTKAQLQKRADKERPKVTLG